MFILIVILIETCCLANKAVKMLRLELKSKATDIKFLTEYVILSDNLNKAHFTDHDNIEHYQIALSKKRMQLTDLHIV